MGTPAASTASRALGDHPIEAAWELELRSRFCNNGGLILDQVSDQKKETTAGRTESAALVACSSLDRLSLRERWLFMGYDLGLAVVKKVVSQ